MSRPESVRALTRLGPASFDLEIEGLQPSMPLVLSEQLVGRFEMFKSISSMPAARFWVYPASGHRTALKAGNMITRNIKRNRV